MFKRIAAFAILCLALSLSFRAQALSAKAYALVEQSSGRLISGQNADMQLPMASTTKIMTALIACESGKLDKTITVSPDALRVEGTSMGLLPAEKLTLRELVYGLLLESGNDAANAIAFELSGSISGFADRMNQRAQQLGLANTHFVNPSGLDADGHYTTACDLARLGAVAMKNVDFAKIAGTKKIKISYNGNKNGRTLINHNKLLGTVDGVIGIKTGFTKKDGRCLVTCACRDGVTLVLATLKDPDDWDDHKQILDSGFSQLKKHSLLSGPLELTAKVVGGVSDEIKIDFDRDISAALSDSEVGNIRMSVELPEFIYAPVKKGQVIGKLVFRVNDQAVASTPLMASQDVRPSILGQKRSRGVNITLIVLLAAGAAGFIIINRIFDGRRQSAQLVRKLKEK